MPSATPYTTTAADWLALVAAFKRADAAKLKTLANNHGMGSACDDILDVAEEMGAKAGKLAAQATVVRDALNNTTVDWLTIIAADKMAAAAKLKELADSHGIGSASDEMLDVAEELDDEAEELTSEAADLNDTLQKIEATEKATALMRADTAKLKAHTAKLVSADANVKACAAEAELALMRTILATASTD
jgi:hypothetical protein